MKHYYRGLDDHKDYNFKVSLDMRTTAELVDEQARGTHRLLSHLIDVRREKLAERVAMYRARGDNDVADCTEQRGDQIADGLEKLLESLG